MSGNVRMMVTVMFSPGGFPTSGSTSAGRRRVGRAAPIHLFESFLSAFAQHQSSKLFPLPNLLCPKYSLNTHQFIRDTLWPMQGLVAKILKWKQMLSTSAKMRVASHRNLTILSASIPATKKSKSAMSSDAKLWSSFIKMLFIHNHSMIQILSQYDKRYACFTKVYHCCQTRTNRLIEGEKCCQLEPPVKCAVQCLESVLTDVTKQRWPGFSCQNWAWQGTLTRK